LRARFIGFILGETLTADTGEHRASFFGAMGCLISLASLETGQTENSGGNG
jgi:hypothetical protein